MEYPATEAAYHDFAGQNPWGEGARSDDVVAGGRDDRCAATRNRSGFASRCYAPEAVAQIWDVFDHRLSRVRTLLEACLTHQVFVRSRTPRSDDRVLAE